MEERMIDKDDGRKIKIKKNALGGIEDAVEEGDEGVREEEEIAFEMPEVDEENEDLIGLSEEQMRELQKKHEEALKERDRMLEEGEKLLKKSKFQEAEPFFGQALLYDPDCRRAKEALWLCRTENFQNVETFYDLKHASAIAEEDERTRTFVRKHAGEMLAEDRRAYEEEAAPLKKRVMKAQSERRAAFDRNRKYYSVRFLIFLTGFFLFAFGAVVSAYFIVRTSTVVPIVLTAVFGALALIALAVAILFSRKLLVAQRYCRANEKLSSTEDGARLEFLLKRLKCLALILDDEEDENR